MDMWKWNLAFQCVVNIGVRGTEAVRTRVVEADMVPVIATILDNYIKVIEKCRDKQELDKHGHHHHHHHHHRHRHHESRSARSSSLTRRSSARIDIEGRTFRRHNAPPNINVPTTLLAHQSLSNTLEQNHLDDNATTLTASGSSSQRPVVPTHRSHPLQARRNDVQSAPLRPLIHSMAPAQPTPAPSRGPNASAVERLTMMTPFVQPINPSSVSQPASPTTPLPPTLRESSSISQTSRRRRPSVRHETSVESDDMNADSMPSDEAPDTDMSGTAEMRPAVDIQDISMEEGESMMTATALDMAGPMGSETHEGTNFGMNHTGQLGAATPTPVTTIGLSPNRPAMPAPAPPSLPSASVPRYLLDRQVIPSPQMISAMPREEDVLMSLQLLAYVSKYCNLRSYFQKSHLVPRLKIGKEINLLDSDGDLSESIFNDEENFDEEYLLPDDFNIFPLVEKFTVRYHSTDMQYWAGVVMRNLCRKDDTREGIRQCAYYQCGKWEEFPRQFAKCRRCRRTKYCSKECQKSAWVFHRHWCVAASSS